MTSTTVSSGRGELTYLAPRSTVLRRFTAPGASINTGDYESHVVPIRNGRPVQDSFDLDVHGFTLVEHTSAVADFTDKAGVDAVYVPEVLAFVEAQLGADDVVSRGWVLRRSAAPGENASQPQAGLVHVDYAPDGAAEVAVAVYAEHFPDGPGYSRAVATSTWRVQPPAAGLAAGAVRLPQRRPGDGLPNTLYFVDAIPEDPFGRSTGCGGSPAARSSSTIPRTSGGTSRG